MTRCRQCTTVFVFSLLFLTHSLVGASQPLFPPGDINTDGVVALEDAVLGLRISAGINALEDVNAAADVNADGQISLPDVICILQQVAGLRSADSLAARAGLVGPLSGAQVRIFALYAPDTPVFETLTGPDGGFAFSPVNDQSPDTLLLVQVSGGTDTDADGDGIPDVTGTPSTGTVCALVPLSDFNAQTFRVSVLTDMVYQYTKNLMGDVTDAEIIARMDHVAATLIKEDISGDGLVDGDDVWAFDPVNSAHRAKLWFDMDILGQVGESGFSILTSYYENQPEERSDLLENAFGSRLSLFPGADPMSDTVNITLAATGKGTVTSSLDGLTYDTVTKSSDGSVKSALTDRSDTQTISFTATPASDTEILGWSGCDSVSDGVFGANTICNCLPTHDRIVMVDFGYTETLLETGTHLVDLSDAVVTVSEDQTEITASAAPGDAQMADKIAAIKAGDYVVGNQGYGFLRQVISVSDQGGGVFLLLTGDASLDDVIAQGSARLEVQTANGGVASLSGIKTASATASAQPPVIAKKTQFGGQTAIAPVMNVETPQGVQYVPSKDPTDTRFHFDIGPDASQKTLSTKGMGGSGEIFWTDPDTGASVRVEGTVDVSIRFEWEIDYSMFGRLQTWKLVPVIEAKEDLTVEFGGILKTKKDQLRKKIGSFEFAPVTFFIGPVPVVVVPELEVYLGLDAEVGCVLTTGVELTQTVKSGVLWTRDQGATWVKSFTPGFDFSPPPSVSAYAEAKPYIKPEAGMMIYGVTGPKVDIKGYLKFRAEAAADFDADMCDEGINISAFWGVDAGFSWDTGAEKLSRLLLADANETELRFSIYAHEGLIKRWNVLGMCGSASPYLDVSAGPSAIIRNLAPGTSTVLNESYTIQNTGDLEMDWQVSALFPDGRITFDNQVSLSGTLQKDETRTFIVRIDPSGLSSGEYVNRLWFENQYDGGGFSSAGGSRSIPVSVRVGQGTGGDSDFSNSLGMNFVYISPGTFMMGSPEDEPGRRGHETLHQVTLTRGYYMQTTEVTQGQWMAVMGSNPSYFQNCGDNCPVERVSWDDVQDFIAALNTMGQGTYRLPTEAEWEYAARAGSATAFANGGITELYCGHDPNLNAMGWYCGNSDVSYSGCYDASNWGGPVCAGPHPVAQKQANAWGLYDMHGNVWEWCQDWYGNYPTGSVTDSEGPSSGDYRVLRGGCWIRYARNCRSAFRSYYDPGASSYYLGFRLVASQVSQ